MGVSELPMTWRRCNRPAVIGDDPVSLRRDLDILTLRQILFGDGKEPLGNIAPGVDYGTVLRIRWLGVLSNEVAKPNGRSGADGP